MNEYKNNRINQLLEERNVSIGGLAVFLGESTHAISMCIEGQSPGGLMLWGRIAAHFEVSLPYLWCYDDPPSDPSGNIPHRGLLDDEKQ